MKYYSTNKQAPVANLEEAVVKGLAGDKGLYMPEYIDSLDEEVIANMKNQSFHEIACTVARDVLRGRHRTGGIGRYRKRYALLRDPGGTRKG